MLQQNDPEVAAIIQREAQRQEHEIELIASENYVSQDVLEANGSILTNKYAEWYPGRRYYGWCGIIDEVEQLAIDRAKELFWADYVNVQPLSWSPANMAVYMAVLQPWDTVLWLSLDQWGHLSHGHPMNFSGKLFNMIPYHLDKETARIDMDEVERLAREHTPKMILAGFSAYPRNLDWKRFRDIADQVGAILFADIAHIAWLVAAGVIENPVPYCDIVSTTTHKTLRGPRWWMIMSTQQYADDIAKSVFPGIQWWPHENLIAAKAVAFWEALRPEFRTYQEHVIRNAQRLATSLQEAGFTIISWGTDNHLVLVDVFDSYWVSGKQAEKALEAVGLSTNKNMIPYDTRKPLDPSGIRIGTPAATTRGMGESEMRKIADIFTQAIKSHDNQEILSVLKGHTEDLCKAFPIYSS